MARRRTALLVGLAAVLAALGVTGAPVSEAADQTVTVSVLPPVSQPGPSAGSMTKARVVLAVQVQPATTGRGLSLSRLVRKSWQHLDVDWAAFWEA